MGLELLPELVPVPTRLSARLIIMFLGAAPAPMLVGPLLSCQHARARLVDPEQRDDTFRPFTRRMHQLAERFEARAILDLVNQYRERGR